MSNTSLEGTPSYVVTHVPGLHPRDVPASRPVAQSEPKISSPSSGVLAFWRSIPLPRPRRRRLSGLGRGSARWPRQIALPGLPRTRTCGFPASGSSAHGFTE